MEQGYWFVMHLRCQLGDAKSAQGLLDFLAAQPSLPGFAKWAQHEPIRKPLNAKTTAEAAALLSGAPRHTHGGINLQSQDGSVTAHIAWHSEDVTRWMFVFVGEEWDSPEGQSRLQAFATSIASAYPCICGGLAPIEDWMAKHWQTVIRPSGGESVYKRGFDFAGAVTGLYGLTLLGPEAVSHLGREALQALAVDAVVDLGKGGLLLRMRPDLLTPSLPERLAQEQAMAASLADEAIFDIQRHERVLRPISLG